MTFSTLNPLGAEFGFGGVRILNGSADPTAGAGFEAALGSIYQRTNGSTYTKTGSANTAWTVNAAGATGPQGPAGPAVFLDAEQGNDGDPGMTGAMGPTGAQGPTGPAILFLDDGPNYDDQGPIAQPQAAVNSKLVYNVIDFGAVDDLITVFDGAITVSTATLVCATSTPFLATDVGKRITVARAGASGAQLTTTISAFSSSSTVTLAANAGTTASAAGTSFGTDNATAIQNAINAASALKGGVVFFPVVNKGRYGVSTGITVTTSGIRLTGVATSFTSDIGDYTRGGGSWLCWWGTTSGSFTSPLLQISAVSGAGNQSLYGSVIENLSLDCRNGDTRDSSRAWARSASF